MKLIICVGSCCYSKGAQEIIDFIGLNYPEVEVKGAFCLGACSQGVSVSCNDIIKDVKTVSDIDKIIKELK